MGISIIAVGKDFSSLGLGNVHLVEKYITNANITNETQKAALRAFYTSFKNAGFFQKFAVFRLFFAGTALADSLNFIDPELGSSHKQATYQNDNPSYHTTGGWTPNAGANHYGLSNWNINGSINSFHAHAWNMTAETQSGTHYLLGANANGAGNDFYISLSRFNSGNSRGHVSPFTSSSSTAAPGGYDTTKTGLLSISRQSGGVVKLYDAGAVITNETKANNWSTNGTSVLYEGALTSSSSAVITSCTLRCLGYGFSAWTDADELALKNMIAAFNTALA